MKKLLTTLLLVAGLAACHGNEKQLAPRLQSYVDDNVMAGAVVLVADKENILLLETVGYADLAEKKPMREDTFFWIASMTKPMTGAAVMMLVDEGKLSLDDPLEKFIPEFADIKVKEPDGTLRPPSRPPTLRDVLTHTAGMNFTNSREGNRLDIVPLATTAAHSALDPLRSDPGVKYSYSNMGIDVAGRVVEVVSGMPFETFLQTRLFDPLGMADTTFFPTPAQLSRLAKSYKPNAERDKIVETHIHFLKQPLDAEPRYPNPGGGLFSTARDVVIFNQMLLNKGVHNGVKILSAEAVHAMTTKQTPPEVKDYYGIGVSASGRGEYFGHDGAYGTSMNTTHGVIAVFLVQNDGRWIRDNPRKDFDNFVRENFLNNK